MNETNALIGAMILVLTASIAAAEPIDYQPIPKPKLGSKIGISVKDFEAVKTGLEQNAAALLDGQTPNRAALVALRDVQYDEATWTMVEAYLKTSLPNLTLPKAKDGATVNVWPCHRLYVACKLLAPLTTSKPDIICKALPLVRELENKYHNAYMPIPKSSPYVLASCRWPAHVPIGELAAMIIKADTASQRKAAMEQPAICTNESVGELDGIYCRMMAFAGDKAQDAKLVDWILTNEAEKNYVWTLGVEALICEAASGDMSKERARDLFPKLIMAGKSKYIDNKDSKMKEKEIEWARRWYRAKHLPEFQPEDITPDYTLSWDYPGYMLLTAAKWMDMVVKGIKDPHDKIAMLVHNPHKGDNPGWRGPDHPTRPFASDPERWWILDPGIGTKGGDPAKNNEKAPPGFKEPSPT